MRLRQDDNHAEEIVTTIRQVFGRGNDFAAKITYNARDPKQLLQNFRNSPTLRVAVTVDMIATGTDVKPLECVFFMRDVRSATYFEQMKGRGARTIPDADFRAVTPDATAKTRFVIVDAIGVTEHGYCPGAAAARLPGCSPRATVTPGAGPSRVRSRRYASGLSVTAITSTAASAAAARIRRGSS